MSPSPANVEDESAIDQYSAAWQAIMQLVREGSSWSGHERNCAYLNEGGTFANASHVSGLDFTDDGRAFGVTDWDHDGDLDIWFRNRTAPRLRLMLNQSSLESRNRTVMIKLVGAGANRDAVGAVVDLHLKGRDAPITRSVRAGEMFLSQSGKWLHFGVSDETEVEAVDVLWPGGARTTVKDIAPGGRYVIGREGIESEGNLAGRTLALKAGTLPTEVSHTGVASFILPQAIPLSFSTYFDPVGREVPFAPRKEGQLLLLWSAGCPHCKSELSALSKSPADRRILALCVDGNTSKARIEAEALLTEVSWKQDWGMIALDDLEHLQAVQEALFDNPPQFAVPLGMLLDNANQMVAIYRGPVSEAVLAHDWKLPAGKQNLRDLAPPFPGRWFTTPADEAYPPKLIARRTQARYPELGLSYLHHAARAAKGREQSELVAEVARKHYALARKAVDKLEAADAEYHFARSLESNPNDARVHNDYGTMLAKIGRLKEGADHFAEAVRLKPDYAKAKENLARAQQLLQQSGNQP